MGCRYEPDPTSPCSCGMLVCDGGVCCGTTCETPAFPDFERACETDSGCFVALHQSDCCGTFVALGLATGERERFTGAEASCESMYPGCGCAARPTSADDGTSCLDASPSVACVDGFCRTTCGGP
jgi:hypothetical protein